MGLVQTFKNAIFPEAAIIKEMLNAVVKSGWDKAFGKGSIFMPESGKVTNPYAQVSSVYKAVKAICDSAAQADYILKNYNSESEVSDRFLEDLMEKPNPLMSWTDFIQAVVGFSALYDEYFIIKTYSDTRKPNDLPLELWPFNPKDFQEVLETQGGLNRLTGWKYANTVYSLDEVIHSKGFNPSSLIRPVNPTEVIKNEISISWQSLIFNKAFFENSGTPSLALSTPNALSQPQREQLKVWVDKEFKGASKAFKTILLESGLKAEHLSHSHTDMEFTEQSKYTREEILGIWRVPKSIFSITDNLNYATSREQSRIFWEDTVLPVLNKIMWSINNEVVKPYNKDIYIEVDVSNVPAFKELLKEKIKTGLELKALGIPLNDIIEALKLPFKKYPWGNTIFVSFSDTPIDQIISGESKLPKDQPQEPAKSFTKSVNEISMKSAQARVMFLKVHEYIESKMEGKVSGFFYEQRKRALTAFSKGVQDYNTKRFNDALDWEEEDNILISRMMPYITASVKAGVDYAEMFGIQARNQEVLKAKISSLIAMQSKKITNINRTIKSQLTYNVSEAINDGIRNGLSASQMQDAILESVKGIYNMAGNRALLIARTETTGAMNGGSMAYYTEAGIKYKEWLNAGDAHVRDSHKDITPKVVSIFSKFSNGLMYPGDPNGDPSEICNCRCSAAPWVEK